MSSCPNHIALIMDGNNRYSKKYDIALYDSYKKGANKLLEITDFIFKNYDTNYISAFALSHNNTRRPKSIINNIIRVLDFFLNKENHIKDRKFNILFKGDLSFFSKNIQKKIESFINDQQNYEQKLIIYLNYSGQLDIIEASKKLNKRCNISLFKKNLISNDIPDPELLIRSGGHNRISDFFLFQIAFTELFFIKKLWPELTKKDIKKIYSNFKIIERKFGY